MVHRRKFPDEQDGLLHFLAVPVPDRMSTRWGFPGNDIGTGVRTLPGKCDFASFSFVALTFSWVGLIRPEIILSFILHLSRTVLKNIKPLIRHSPKLWDMSFAV